MGPNRKFLPFIIILVSCTILAALIIFPRYRVEGLSSPLPSGGVSYATPPMEHGFSPYSAHRDFFKGLVAGKLMNKDLSEEDKQWVQKIVTHFDFSASELLCSPEELKAKGIKPSGEAAPTPAIAAPSEWN